ncbi:hypothetical protein HZA86_04445 [Candidatus Uhrbacteria bacterium]|nr:hypothetical protein [Candidatus Uhrbacteria bacterium]
MLTEPISRLIERWRSFVPADPQPHEPAVVTIHVDEIAAKIAKFYERIRNVVDYREEHLFRKNCILRGLQRRALMGGDQRNVGLELIKEIIRSGHLPNDTIPETRAEEVDRILQTLATLLDRSASLFPQEAEQLRGWLIRLSACAVEECLAPPIKDRVVSELMYTTIEKHLMIKGEDVSASDRKTQLFIAVQKTLLKVDEDQLAYRLLKFLYPYWDNPSPTELESIARQLPSIYHSTHLFLKDPLNVPFYKLCNHYNTVFLLIGDAIFANPETRGAPIKLVEDPNRLHAAVTEAYGKRFKQQKRSLQRLAFFSIISLFITKVLIALAVEIPIDRWMNDFSVTNTIVNIAFPPLLLLVIILLIRMPSSKNIARVIAEVDAVLYEDQKKDYLLVLLKDRPGLIKSIVRLFYFALSVSILGLVSNLLYQWGFSIASIVVFILFTSIVAATGVKVHNRSREISLEEHRPTFVGFIADLVFIPFVSLGTITIAGLEHVKFLVLIVNLIDVPFLEFVTFIEHFNTFLRYKKDELH